VWSWNTCLAIVCGDAVVWKPSDKTPLTALACAEIFAKAAKRFGAGSDGAPKGLLEVLYGGKAVGEALTDDPRVALVSATGSTRMGREVGPRVMQRFGRVLLELGGNNGMIVCPSADLELAVRAITFSAVGTAGQRCTTLRRLIVHEKIYDRLVPRLKKIYGNVKIGNPLDARTLVGPLIDEASFKRMQAALAQAKKEGGKVTGGERVKVAGCAGGFYVKPALVELPGQTEVMKEETFAPILYIVKYKDFAKAIQLHNDVPQGLSSCIFTRDVGEAEQFVSATGSDCGIANVNIGPSGAEIGGAFGGEKETGGGRESGSDAWKAYMRRATNTVNYSDKLPLAQGIRFDVG
jgi:aldehyde dehydrogenase (NAD+)